MDLSMSLDNEDNENSQKANNNKELLMGNRG